MIRYKSYKKVVAATLTATMVAGLGITSNAAASYDFNPPESPMEVDENIITASVHRAGSVLPEILGLNTKCGFSMINGTMPNTLEEARGKLMLGAFGTDANDNPDPFYYNYFYNFYAAANGLSKSGDAVIIPVENIAASPVAADRTIVDGYGTSISLAGRPDILIGCSSANQGQDTDGYNDLIAAIRTGKIGGEYYQEGDEDYAPYLVGYSTTTTYDMITTLNEVANIMNEITDETGKVGRYGDPVAIAEEFGDYVCGVSTYILSEMEEQGVERKSVAVVQKINSDGTFTLADAATKDATSTVRGVEYVALISDNIAATEGTTVNGEQLLKADAIIISGSNGGGNDDTVLPNTRAGLKQALGENASALDDKIVIAENPDTIYGITMNSIENGMGFGYFGAYLYSEILDPVDICAYFYEKFYHVTDSDSLQSITSNTFADVVDYLPNGRTTDLSDYNSNDIAAKLAQGKAYYYENISQFEETALTKVWGTKQGDKIAAGNSKVYDTENDALAYDTGTWKSNSTGWWYEYFDGTYLKNCWKQIDGKWYHFDNRGYMQTGWQLINNKWYYFGSANDGSMKSGWQKINSKWYYLGSADDGAMKTGWQKVDGTWYYMNGKGVMQTGWIKPGSTWYYLNGSGAMQTGWIKLGNTWYYLYSNGAMASNTWVGNYYLKASGAMAVSEWVDNNRYYVNQYGVWVPGK